MELPKYKVIEEVTAKAWIEEWSRIHIELVSFRNNFMADYCEEMMKKAKEAYYNSGDVIMEDDAYDRLESYLLRLRPDSSMLETVGVAALMEDIDEDDI